MTKLPDTGHITPEEYQELANIPIQEVWRRIENERLQALAGCTWDGFPFDYYPVSGEVVRAIVAGHPVDYHLGDGRGTRRIEGDKSIIRIMISKEFTPELYVSEKPKEWKIKAIELGPEYINKWRDAGYEPTVDDAAIYCETELYRLKFEGRDGKLLATNIRREVLDKARLGRPRGFKSKKPKVPREKVRSLP